MTTYQSVGGSTPSLWLSRPSLLREAEVAVVGGGLVGLSTAYWLRRAGRQVVVLEAEHVAGRTSGRNAGFLLTGTAEPYVRLARTLGPARALALWQLSRDNRELLRAELIDSGRLDCEFLPEGSWIAVPDDAARVAELRASAEQLQAAGIELRWVEGAELRRASGSERLGGALFQPRDGGLDPVRLARGLARVGGAELITGVRVHGLEPAGERVRLHSNAGEVLAERVVVALNAYVPSLIPQLAAEVRPVRGQVLATEPGPRPLAGVWYVNDGFEYLRQLPDGTVVLGGCREVALEDEVGYLETPTATVQQALEHFLADYFPGLAGRPIRHRWAGTMAFTDDGLPAIGAVPHLPAALYAAGMNGHGLSLAFAIGRYLARRLSGEESGELLPAGA